MNINEIVNNILYGNLREQKKAINQIKRLKELEENVQKLKQKYKNKVKNQ